MHELGVPLCVACCFYPAEPMPVYLSGPDRDMEGMCNICRFGLGNEDDCPMELWPEELLERVES